MSENLIVNDISDEAWRDYEFGDTVHRIVAPVKLYARPGGTTHRVLDDSGLVHILPAPGYHGCRIVFQPKDPSNPVAF